MTLHADHINCSQQTAHSSNPEREDAQPLAWKAPRTGRIIRSVHTGERNSCMTITCSSHDSPIDPTIPYSELQHNVAPLSPSQTSRDSPSRLMSLDTNSLIAEALYIARPLVHSKHIIIVPLFYTCTSHSMDIDYNYYYTFDVLCVCSLLNEYSIDYTPLQLSRCSSSNKAPGSRGYWH